MSKLICIDAGHGGADSGAVNGGLYEKATVLAIAKLLKKELIEKGQRVIMTREVDKALTLQQRCDISNKNGANIFVSIHANSASNKDAIGIETFKALSVQSLTHALATNVQNEMIRATGAKNRGVKSEAYYVLKNTKAPAILVEVGFISNEEEKKLLFKTYYQEKLAKAIAKGIMDTIG